MFEENQTPKWRRILWYVLWFVVIAAVLWLLVWLLFFRGNNNAKDKNTGLKAPSTSQNQSNNSHANTPAPSTNSTPTQQQTTPQPNTQLSNTGPGDVLAIVAASMAAGTVVYQVRLRRKRADLAK